MVAVSLDLPQQELTGYKFTEMLRKDSLNYHQLSVRTFMPWSLFNTSSCC